MRKAVERSNRSATLGGVVTTEHLYYPCASGYVFAANSLCIQQAMPFYGLVMISTNGESLRVRTGQQIVEHPAIALWAKDVEFIVPATPFVSIAVNPLHRMFRAFAALPAPYAIPLDPARYAHFAPLMKQAVDGCITHTETLTLHTGVMSASQTLLPPLPPLDNRAQLLTRMLWDNPRCSLGHMAKQLNLSYHRTSHLFADTVGISIRTYQLWQKLYRSGAQLMAGASLTDTAHAAGFVDSAHYSRAFLTAFGRCPTKMFKTRRMTVFYGGNAA
jgi:AraC-like DNA-binding protein